MRQALSHGQAYLAGVGRQLRGDTPALDAEVLLRHLLGLSRAALYTYPDRRLTVPQWERYQDWLSRRGAAEPVSHITGEREFMGLVFAVDRRVLVPRPETEALVERALALLSGPSDGVSSAHPRAHRSAGTAAEPSAGTLDGEGTPAGSTAGRSVVDVGTGSGAIAVSLAALATVPLRLYATDRSRPALEVARQNARRLLGRPAGALGETVSRETVSPSAPTADDRRPSLGAAESVIHFIHCSLVDALRGPFDLVLANLPYVPTGEIPGLPATVRRYEPLTALDGGEDGLDLYRALLADLPGKLRTGATLLLECGPNQVPALRGLLREALPDAQTEVVPDLAGRGRVVQATCIA